MKPVNRIAPAAHAFVAACIAILSVAGSTRAALITFSGAYSNGQATIPSTYQPLLSGYPATGGPPAAVADGGALGITTTWDGKFATSNESANGGVTDHTGDNAGVVAYDNGNSSVSVTFDAPVKIPSFYYAYYNTGNATANPIFHGYTNASDTTPAITFNGSYPGGAYQWQLGSLGATPITRFEMEANDGSYLQLDDVTVNAAPEPATLGLIGIVGLGLLARRHRA